MLFRHKILLVSLLLNSILFLTSNTEAASNKVNNSSEESKNNDQQKQTTFSVLACITWWSHDAVGYHPAMSLFLENTSGKEITGGEIPFQGRFTDVRTGDVTVSREYRRAPIRDHERLSIFFRGPRYYELPIDSSLWPTIECKAMCRLNNTEVEDLFMVHLAQVTLSDEEAQAQLVAQAGRSPLLCKSKISKKSGIQMAEIIDPEPKSGLPLHASAGAIPGASSKNTESPKSPASAKSSRPTSDNLYPKFLPGVGSDFYAFDKIYGDAIEVHTGTGGDDLTWTHYKSSTLIKDVFVGSRNANKADNIIIVLNTVLKDKELLPLAKLLANYPKHGAIAPFAHSVRYLPGGRSEIMTTAIRENRILAFQIQNDGSIKTVLAVSRLPGDIETALSNYCKHVDFLKFLAL